VEIRIGPHTLLQASKRGVSVAEIEETLHNGIELPAKHGRRARAKIFECSTRWKGRHAPRRRAGDLHRAELRYHYGNRVLLLRGLAGAAMIVTYHEKHDLLCTCLDDRPKQVTNLRFDEDIVLDAGEQDRGVGIEILDASKRVDLDRFPTVDYRQTA